MNVNASRDPKLVYKRLAPFTRFWYTTSYLLLAAGLAFCLLDSTVAPLNKALAAGLALLWAAWYYVFVMRRTRLKLDATRTGISFLLAIAVSMGLSWLHPAFLMFGFGFYGLTFAVLPVGWAIPLVVLPLVCPGLAHHRIQP